MSNRKISFTEAINEALFIAMKKEKKVMNKGARTYLKSAVNSS